MISQNHILLVCASFTMVGLKAFQNQSVIHDKWLWIPPVSYLMSAAELFIYVYAAHKVNSISDGLVTVFFLGTGAWTGCWIAMWLHNNWRG